jgi:hypothetical protein
MHKNSRPTLTSILVQATIAAAAPVDP